MTIICGAPGDEAHHVLFEQRLGLLRKIITSRFGVRTGDLRIYYGPESAGYAGSATLEHVRQACDAIKEGRQAGRNVWLLVMGHANDAPGDVRFNLPGDDLSGKELGGWLKMDQEAPGALNVILTTACSGRAVAHLSGAGRSVLAATNPTEGYDETVFPEALVQSLESAASDADKDGALSMTEIFLAAKGRVDAVYRARGCIQTEHAVLDGDGDGRATQRPSEKDAAAATGAGHSLKILTAGSSS